MEELVELLGSEDGAIKETVIQMFRKSGRADCLFGLVFSRDNELVKRIRRYLDDAEKTNS